jgi:hypothetical protein
MATVKTDVKTPEFIAVGRPAKHGEKAYRPRPHQDPKLAGAISLGQYRRGPDDLTWSATFVQPDGTKKVLSLGKVTELQAHVAAARLFDSGLKNNFKAEAKTKAPVFRDAANIAADRLLQQYRHTLKSEGTSKAAKFSAPRAIIIGKLMPVLGDVAWPEVQGAADRWLSSYRLADGRIPAKGTIGNINAALQRVCRVAIANGWLSRKSDDRPKLSKTDFRDSSREPAFTREEMEQLRRFMSDEWVGESTLRHLTRVFVGLLSTSGLRPGIETNAIREAQINITNAGILIEVLPNQGKYTRHRQAICRENDVFEVREILQKHLAWRKSKWTAEKVSDQCSILANPQTGRVPQIDDEFKELLKDARLLICPVMRKPRVPYSLRHYFFSQALIDGIPEHDLITIGGTSSTMLKKHYSHIRGTDIVSRVAARPAVSSATLERMGLLVSFPAFDDEGREGSAVRPATKEESEDFHKDTK